MKNKNKYRIRLLTLSAVFCAMTYAATTFVRIPISSNGYVHIGDAFIYLAAAMLPTPFACGIGAVGAGLADLIGYPIYAPGTILIKVLTALLFTSKKDSIICAHNLTALIPASLICVGGYYIYEVILTSSLAAPIVGIPFNVAQSAASAIIFCVIGITFDNLNLRQRIIK